MKIINDILVFLCYFLLPIAIGIGVAVQNTHQPKLVEKKVVTFITKNDTVHVYYLNDRETTKELFNEYNIK